jgi:hypothetical protein
MAGHDRPPAVKLQTNRHYELKCDCPFCILAICRVRVALELETTVVVRFIAIYSAKRMALLVVSVAVERLALLVESVNV